MCLHSQSRPSPLTLEQKLKDHGLVDVAGLDSTICVSLMYAREDNFTGVLLYTDGLERAYLQPEAAAAVVRAQAELGRISPGHRFCITMDWRLI